MHLIEGAGTARKDAVPSVLDDNPSRIQRAHISMFVVVALMGLVVSAAFLAPLATDSGSDGSKARTSYEPHFAIMIMSDDDFTSLNGVSAGDGTASNPYIIENWEIEAIGYGLMIMDTTKHYVIRNVHVLAPGTFGIYAVNAPNGTIENCLLDDGMIGILAVGCDNFDIVDNVIENQDMIAVEVADSEWTNITGNQFADNNMSSLALLYMEHSMIDSNTILRTNMTGMMVLESNYTTVVGNNISDSPGMGLYLAMANHTLVRNNSLTMNEMYGLYLESSTDVTIYHNKFIGNAVQAEQVSATSVAWDNGYPDGGNYWSDYTGLDLFSGPDQDIAGSDGMGDTEYITSGGGVDRYPWMWEGFSQIPEFGTVLIPVVSIIAIVAVAGMIRIRKR